ncbi:Uncharacterised protein [Mycobacterium tuberculosis]|nr:Uncharacterised protein [Mycobacterium tuberculosis]
MGTITGIGSPPPGPWIEVQLLTHFASVAARLPGIHRAKVARPVRRSAGRG